MTDDIRKKLRTTEDWDHPIETLIEAYNLAELPVFLRRASDEQLEAWEALLKEEDNRLRALLEHPDSALLGIDRLNEIEDRQDAVMGAQSDLRDEQERRAGADDKEDDQD